MKHQRTDLPPNKAKQKQYSHKSGSKSYKRYSSKHKNQRPPHKPKCDTSQAHQRRDGCSKCGDSKHVEGFKCPVRKFQCKTCNKYGHFSSMCYKNKVPFKSKTPRHISCKWEWDMCKIQYVASQVIWPPVMNHSAYNWRYSAHELNPNFPHLIISLLILPTDWSHTTWEIST